MFFDFDFGMKKELIFFDKDKELSLSIIDEVNIENVKYVYRLLCFGE